ncbi:MAG: hypothetical protein WBD64_05405 [Candidatus Zixiibacteriota bacterium]|jgi:hypothetical protein
MTKKKVLLIISLAFMLGGIGRLVVNESVFKIFAMEHLWSGDPFFIYIYKLLGVFVLWMGILLFISSRDVIRYRGIIRGSILGLLLFFVVSLLTGLSVGLKLQYFLVDSIFSLILVLLFYIIQKD